MTSVNKANAQAPATNGNNLVTLELWHKIEAVEIVVAEL